MKRGVVTRAAFGARLETFVCARSDGCAVAPGSETGGGQPRPQINVRPLRLIELVLSMSESDFVPGHWEITEKHERV